MRERISVGVTGAAVMVLITLSVVFARSQNPSERLPAADVTEPTAGASPAPGVTPDAASPAAAAASVVTAEDSIRGRALFASKGCQRCHSVAGEGNARNALDGVGARRTPAELRAWTIGAEALADSLPPSAFRAKQAFQQMRAEELGPLITYLSSLKQPPKPE
jgi:mono/diheme cytochrome c family protein